MLKFNIVILLIVIVGVDGGNPYISAAKLLSLAQTSAIQAKNAVANQQIAGRHAEFNVLNHLAQTALTAASLAQAVVAGKKLAVEQLRHQLEDAKKTEEAEIAQHKQLEEISSIFSKVANDSEQQVKNLTQIVEKSKNEALNATRIAEIAKNVSETQFGLVEEIKQKIANLTEQTNGGKESGSIALETVNVTKSEEHEHDISLG